MDKKQLYETPQSEVVRINPKGILCNSFDNEYYYMSDYGEWKEEDDL